MLNTTTPVERSGDAMEGDQEAGEEPRGESQELSTDPAVLKAISILEKLVEAKIGTASDGKL
jgi:hypothetical protein